MTSVTCGYLTSINVGEKVKLNFNYLFLHNEEES